MPRKPTGRPANRPPVPIDWKKVDTMVLAGCSGSEIAGSLDVHPDSFYRRFEREKGVSFTVYRSSRKTGGDANVRLRQYLSAMHGNTQMLKLLGEERLGQGKRDNIEGSEVRDFIYITEKIQKLENALLSRGISLSDIPDEQLISHKESSREEDQIPDELGSENTMEREA